MCKKDFSEEISILENNRKNIIASFKHGGLKSKEALERIRNIDKELLAMRRKSVKH